MLFGVCGMCSINTSTYWLHLNYQSSNSNIPYLGLTVTRVMPAPSEMASVSPYGGRKKYVMRGGRISAYAKEIYNCLNDSRINPEKRGCSEKQGGRKRSNSVLFRDWSGSLLGCLYSSTHKWTKKPWKYVRKSNTQASGVPSAHFLKIRYSARFSKDVTNTKDTDLIFLWFSFLVLLLGFCFVLGKVPSWLWKCSKNAWSCDREV